MTWLFPRLKNVKFSLSRSFARLLIKSRVINLNTYIRIRQSYSIHIRLSRRLRKSVNYACNRAVAWFLSIPKAVASGCARRWWKCALGGNLVERDFSRLGNTWMNAHTRVTRHVPLLGWRPGTARCACFKDLRRLSARNRFFTREPERWTH